jgi:hypothetical protein
VAQKFTVPITVKQLVSAGSDAVTVYVDADTYARLKIEAGGRLTWGSGSVTGDTNLYRDSADVLKTDDTFKAPILYVDNIEIDPTGATTNQVLKFDGTKFAPGTASTVGSIDDLSDVTITSPTNGQILKWNGTAWVNDTDAAGSSVNALDDVADVTITTATSGQFLKWNGTAWVNDAIDLGTDTTGNYVSGVSSGTGISVSHTPSEGSTATVSLDATLDNLSNVTVPSPTTNDVLQWNGTAWVNVAASTVGATNLDGLSDVVVTSPLQFQGLMYDGTNWVNSNIPNVYLVRNNTGSTILKGTLVGAVGAEPSGRIDVAPFEVTGTENSELRAMGIAVSNISSGVNGEVMSFGTLTGLDTRGSTASALAVGDETWAAGDILFAHPTVNGKLTNVRPQHDLAVAFITVRHASTGQIAIRIIPGNNHLEWMHDVSLVDKVSGDFLKYNGTLWVNDQINLGTDTVGDYVSSVTAGTGISVDFTPSEGASASVSLNATLDDLSNVSVATPNTNDVLTYNGSLWTSASASGGGGASLEVSATAPISPSEGDLWFNTTTGAAFIYYNSAWVELGGGTMSPYQATSTTRPSSPWTGQHVYETDTGLEYVYGGSAWQQVSGGTAVGNSGLVFVKSQTVGSAVSSVTVSSAFNATYDAYQVIWSGGGMSADENLTLVLGSTTTGYYGNYTYANYTNTTVASTNQNNGSSFFNVGGGDQFNGAAANFTLINPFLTKQTYVTAPGVAYLTYNGTYNGRIANSNSYTAFTIAPAGGTMTGGTIRVYGYRNS